MKRILLLSFLFVICLAVFPASAESFSPAEADSFAQAVFEEARLAGGFETSDDDAGLTRLTAGKTELVYEEGNEYLDIRQVIIGAGGADARGITVGMTGWEEDEAVSARPVLQAYPNGNPRLEGTFEQALLYMYEEEGAFGYGLCGRDGQRILSLEYAAADDHGAALVRYTFLNDALEKTVYYLNEAALIEMQNPEALRSLRDERGYFAYYTGADAEPFAREDLLLGQTDILSMTAEGLADQLGEALRTVPSGSQTRYLWEGLDVTFDETDGAPAALLVTGGSYEGPRGVRVGDTLVSVLGRFKNEDGIQTDKGTLLYGDGVEAPYGIIFFGPDTTTVTYCADTGSGVYRLYCNFVDFILVNYLIAR